MSYKAWLSSPDGFLSLRQPAASTDTDTDQLPVPTLHLQVQCIQSQNNLAVTCSHLLSCCTRNATPDTPECRPQLHSDMASTIAKG